MMQWIAIICIIAASAGAAICAPEKKFGIILKKFSENLFKTSDAIPVSGTYPAKMSSSKPRFFGEIIVSSLDF